MLEPGKSDEKTLRVQICGQGKLQHGIEKMQLVFTSDYKCFILGDPLPILEEHL